MTEPEGTGPRDDGSPDDGSPDDRSFEEPARPDPRPRKSTRTGTVEGQKRMVKKVSGQKKTPDVKAPVKKTGP